ncbi:hypothetical protein BCR35DRAFT_290319 [Leucosporidium creatinivorum]|uniref:Short-chain dehydrogenase n=1 Tax=Leucosporidium creatinivorum TaxID=106004 RepID=A0A1Y2FL76_9BASI|nr:hypothetical protein BCR35DRAFT_290319 [Leucosporidium creatinivorum]
MASLLKPFTQAFAHSQVPSLALRTYLVTGGSNGIGLSVARSLYSKGATVHILSLSEEIARSAQEYIKTGDLGLGPKDGDGEQIPGGKVEWKQCDFEDLNDVATTAKELGEKLERLDGVFLLAGKGVNEFSLTKDGYDSHLTLNNLSHHLLLSHLLPVLLRTSKLPNTDVRIIQMSSELHRATFGGPNETFGGGKFASEEEFKEDIGPSNLYARTKLAVTLFNKAVLQRHLPSPSPILAFTTHPGAVATGQQSQFKPAYGELVGGVMSAVTRVFMSTPDQGSISALWSGTSPELREEGKWKNGSYFTEARENGKESAEASDQDLIDNFYINSEKIIQKVTGGQLGPWREE